MAANTGNIDVITDTSGIHIPNCQHGPTLLFTRYDQGTKSERQFFACSAFRDRKDCPFFQWRDDQRKQTNDKNGQADHILAETGLWPSYSHKQMRKRWKAVKKMKRVKRKLCMTCGLLLLPKDTVSHISEGHVIKMSISNRMLARPSQLFSPLDNNKTYAQYLFSAGTVEFVLATLTGMEVTHVLCVGCPRIHEAIQLRRRKCTSVASSVMSVTRYSAVTCKSSSTAASVTPDTTVIPDTAYTTVTPDTTDTTVTSLLLDLDHRYLQVYPPSRFCRYNMLNHHFFGGPKDQQTFSDFIKKQNGKKVAMVIDPPFGIMTEALAVTLRKIQTKWRGQDSDDAEDCSEMPVFWFFPYFMERRVIETNKGFTMLDYKVDYDNHALFKGDSRKKGSPVRVFTNVQPGLVPHPLTDGYWFCTKCERYSAAENKHCDQCNCCPTKDGFTYRHCDKCERCVKPSRTHCDTCARCDLPQHRCGQAATAGCHICGDVGHKRRECPNKNSGTDGANFRGRKRKADQHKSTKKKRNK